MWQPIETAPKKPCDSYGECTRVLLFVPKGIGHEVRRTIFIGSWDDRDGDWYSDSGEWLKCPTHWMPLPAEVAR